VQISGLEELLARMEGYSIADAKITAQ
jgi:hypothetical protein